MIEYELQLKLVDRRCVWACCHCRLVVLDRCLIETQCGCQRGGQEHAHRVRRNPEPRLWLREVERKKVHPLLFHHGGGTYTPQTYANEESSRMKLILGAGKTSYDGWISTQEDKLNLLNRLDFERRYEEASIDAMLAEHVWEHMTEEEGVVAAKNCYDFLKCGGYLRCAVPDRNFRNEAYQTMVQVGGPGPKEHPAYGHKIVYDYQRFQSVFERAGFEVELLEYCDADGVFHYKYWNESDGKIGRSLRFDTRNSTTHLGMVSIIVDAKKPFVMTYHP